MLRVFLSGKMAAWVNGKADCFFFGGLLGVLEVREYNRGVLRRECGPKMALLWY